jgi:26S proteasome regulatory subunit N7
VSAVCNDQKITAKKKKTQLFSSLIEEGGDWDRRNRLKVYHGLHAVMRRDFKTAAKQFLDTVATFTSYELMDYDTFVVYTVFVTMLALPRSELRDKVFGHVVDDLFGFA